MGPDMVKKGTLGLLKVMHSNVRIADNLSSGKVR